MFPYDYVFVIDLETTGLDNNKDDVIEYASIGYKLDKNGKLSIFCDESDFFVKTNKDISKIFIDRHKDDGTNYTISELTGITPAMLEEEGISEKEFVDHFIKTIYDIDENKKILIIGYNASFDLNFLYKKIHKFYPFFKIERRNVDYLDAMSYYKDHYPRTKEYKDSTLTTAVRRLNIEVQNTHRAIDDVKATYLLFKKLLTDFKWLGPYVNKFGYTEKYGFKNEYKKIRFIPQIAGCKNLLANHSKVLNEIHKENKGKNVY